MSDPEVIGIVDGGVATAILNRPQALNSLNANMVKLLDGFLTSWDSDPQINCIIIRGAGPRAFCAGGDVKACVMAAKSGRQAAAIDFFRTEYTLIHDLSQLARPYISLVDGVVMGGGAGLSINGRFRVATEKSLFAMPECGIGLFTDVAGALFLSAIPGEIGTYLALTGGRLTGGELKRAGLATHLVPSESLPQVEVALRAGGAAHRDPAAVAATLASFEGDAGSSPKQEWDHREAIDACFAADTVEEIYAALQRRGDQWSQDTLAALKKGSPLSQKITLRALRQAQGQSLRDVLITDFRIVCRMVEGPSDFAEGVRATLIDKGSSPAWSPVTLQEVTEEMVDHFFAPLARGQELDLHRGSGTRGSKL
eukprot:CAMPEP_0206136860 /NCGR_PEP_ID=MMETSP1473-20131121/2078_1 /ASSEMBLY_ACC=CAM_ASM_001109 /TAXON_ID=1461547 /ORGANISM="Stichococcus sp, Strain RCC1054" /LENGTH=367 /DNA_ID=CAMNT_0053529675 /DNA_START=101 /DNA_END=1204 /DNA_ORIENTATION=-